MGRPVIEISAHAEVRRSDRHPEHSTLVTTSVNANGDALAAWQSSSDGSLLITSSAAPDREWMLGEAALRPSYLHDMPGDAVLLVHGRGGAGVKNAQIWSSDGVLLRQGEVGPCISELRVRKDDARIVIGRHDEAIATSYTGMAIYDRDLLPSWRYPMSHDLPPVYDAYAVNVDADGVWVYAYSSPRTFVLLRIVRGAVLEYRMQRMDGHAGLVIDAASGMLAFFGTHRDRLAVSMSRLEGREVRHVGEGRLHLTSLDAEASAHPRWHCVGTRAYALASSRVFAVDLATVQAAIAAS